MGRGGLGRRDPRLAGASHYLEHLLFKGTKSRTGYDISAAVDAIGGELNAFTSHEYTCYYARVLAEEAATAVSLVCDVVLDATIARADVDIERGVILEEIAMRDDDPEDTLGDVFAAALFAGHPVSAPVIGTVQTISAMTRQQVAGYYHRRYTPDRMVIAVAGGVDHADVLRWVRAAFRDRITPSATHDPAEIRPAPPRTGRAGSSPSRAPSSCTRTPSRRTCASGCRPAIATTRIGPVLAVLSAILGGGMSSRLFRSIREEHGLAYSVYSGASSYADVGSFSVYAGCLPDHLGQVAKLIGQELAVVGESGITVEELRRAQGQLTGSLVLALEDSESRMSRVGKNMLVRTDYRSVDDELADIRAVTADQVAALAARLLHRPLTAAVVGPYASTDDLPAEFSELTG